MEVQVITDLAEEPIPLKQAKAYLKVDEELSTEDDIIIMCIKAARQHCERYTGLSFGPKTLEVQLPYVDYIKRVPLPYGPNIQVTQVTDNEGLEVALEQNLGGSSWYAEYLKGMSINNTWKEDYGWAYALGADPLGYFADTYYRVRYNCGYAVNQLPETLKLAILKLTAELYENRENSVIGTIIAELPTGVKQLLDLERAQVVFL